MRKTILLLLFIIILNVVYAQQGRIIYTEFDPYPCMTGLPSEQNIILDINHDGIDETLFYRGLGGHNGDPWCILYNPTNHPDADKWKYRDLNYELTDTLSMVAHFGLHYIYNLKNPSYSYHAPSYEVTEMLRIAVRHAVDEDQNGETHYCYGWIEVVGRWTWDKPSWTMLLTVWVPRMAYCTIPDYPLIYGQKDIDGSVASIEDVTVKIYPNPASDYIKIETYHTCQYIKIYSLDGYLVFETRDFASQPTTIDIGNLTTGVYIVKVCLADGREYFTKIIKE